MEGSGSSDEAGDALGVFPAKSPDVVARVMESHRLDPDTVMLLPGGGEAPLGESLGIFHSLLTGGRRLLCHVPLFSILTS
jgi:sulfite reductase alpha subunit-like flavoprotein